jgi:deoxyhypusine synthase
MWMNMESIVYDSIFLNFSYKQFADILRAKLTRFRLLSAVLAAGLREFARRVIDSGLLVIFSSAASFSDDGITFRRGLTDKVALAEIVVLFMGLCDFS